VLGRLTCSTSTSGGPAIRVFNKLSLVDVIAVLTGLLVRGEFPYVMAVRDIATDGAWV